VPKRAKLKVSIGAGGGQGGAAAGAATVLGRLATASRWKDRAKMVWKAPPTFSRLRNRRMPCLRSSR
jgi:hypothetical protein